MTPNPVATPDTSWSRRHMEAAERAIPGGAHTYAKGDDQYPEGLAPVIDHGLGCRVFDIDGNEYVEYGSELTAAERLELFPGADMVKFGVHGSDVTSGAVRPARCYTGRELVAVCSDHPFFSTGDWFIATTPMSAGIPQPVRDLTVGFHYNDLASLQRQLEAHPGQIAAVVLEVEASEPPAPGFLPGIRRLCDEHGVILILDEVITGFRWDLRGAQHICDIRPDLFTLAKGLSAVGAAGPPGAHGAGRVLRGARPGVAAVDDLWRPAVGAERDDDGDRHLRERGRHGAAPRRGRRAAVGLRSRNRGPRAARPRAGRGAARAACPALQPPARLSPDI